MILILIVLAGLCQCQEICLITETTKFSIKMGSLMSKAMDESFKKQKGFMSEQQQTGMERQLTMQNEMRQKQMAMQMSGSRELFNWYGSFYTVALLAMIAGFGRTKNPGILIPALPLTWIVGYQYDWAYGTKVHRIRDGAETILKDESDRLRLPFGMPTFTDIETIRLSPKQAAPKDAAAAE